MKEKRHAIILVSGDNSARKTAQAMYMADYAAKIRKMKFDPIEDIYYTSIEGLVDDMLTTKRRIKIVDEGYFGGTNLESNLPRVIELNTAVNAVRNRGHMIFFIYSKINRATKMLLESANYWFHKPAPEYANFYIRGREFVGNDPWNIDALLKAKSPRTRRWLMKHNENFITTLKTPWLSDELFNKYESQKAKEQEEFQLLKMKTKDSELRQQKIIESIKADYFSTPPRFSLDRIREYLAGRGFTPSLIRKYSMLFRDSIIEEQAAGNAIGA